MRPPRPPSSSRPSSSASPTSDKKRFSLSPDGRHIRAAQGHSFPIDLGLSPQAPPPTLYHGTALRFLPSIRSEGLHPRARQHVHLSVDEKTAHLVGQRHGRPVVLIVEAGRMHEQGFQFLLADNGVWLTSQVPPAFLVFPSSSAPDAATTTKQPKRSK